jgi:hypothetical protein
VVGRRSDHAIKLLPWPLSLASEVVEDAILDVGDAAELGRQAAIAGKPVIENPFPFGDPRRARFDEGWRKEAENDGMGSSSGAEVVELAGHRK